MASDFSGVSSPALKSLQYTPDTSPSTKGLVQPGSGPAGQDPALVAWFEQATAYYDAVMAGDPDTPRPTDMEWSDFMAQLQWAQTTLYGYGNNGMGGSLGGVGGNFGAPQGPTSNQFGGMSGTMDNWVYTEATAKIGFTGNGTHDIWSNDITINVAPVSAKVTIEQTNDTRSSPAESVLKVTITDPATGTQAVYFIHDFDPTKDKLNINTPEEAQITNDSTGYATWGEFKPGGAQDPNAKPDASIEGVEQSDGTLLYEPEFAGETVNFWANPNEDGGSQVHTVYADANISVKPSDEVNVKMVGDVVEVTVTHSDGSTDVYNIQKGYNVNINQKIEYISENGSPVGDDGIDNEDLKKRVTLNGVSGDTVAEGDIDPDAYIQNLLDETGLTEAQLSSNLGKIGYTKLEDLKEDIASGDFPPMPPTAQLLEFLKTLDVKGFKDDLNTYQEKIDDCKPDSEKQIALKNANDSLIELLSILYPNSIVSAGTTTHTEGSFSINGEDYSWTSNGDAISVEIE